MAARVFVDRIGCAASVGSVRLAARLIA
jgi:hypothetical protein